MNIRKNKERQLIDGVSLIANLKDELEDYHNFEKEIIMIIAARNEADLDHIIKNNNDTLASYSYGVTKLKKENFKLKEELAKLKGGKDELQ